MELAVERGYESKILRDEYMRTGSSLVFLYGRRRVGKTTLIADHIRERRSLYFLASHESEVKNRRAFQKQVEAFTGRKLDEGAGVPDWEALLRAVVDCSAGEKCVIVIDEYQNIEKAEPDFPNILSQVWKAKLKDRPVQLILCASLVLGMEIVSTGGTGPLFSAVTARIHMRSLSFRAFSGYMPEKCFRDQVSIYSVIGGIPQYMNLFRSDEDLVEIIDREMLSPASHLYYEPVHLMQQEVMEIGSYFAVTRAIAIGNHKLAAISSELNVRATSLSKYLHTLIDLDILERDVPITESPEKSKRGLYRVRENFFCFWSHYIYPHMGLLETGRPEQVKREIAQSMTSSHICYVYQDVCREIMWELNASDAWPFKFSRLGRYWNMDMEVEIAAIDPEGLNLIVGGCFFRDTPVEVDDLRLLEQKAAHIPWERNHRRIWYVLFSIAGFRNDLWRMSHRREELLLVDHSSVPV